MADIQSKIDDISLLFASCDFKDLVRVGQLLSLSEVVAKEAKGAQKKAAEKLIQGLESFIMGEYKDRNQAATEIGAFLVALQQRAGGNDTEDASKSTRMSADQEKEIRDYATGTMGTLDELEQCLLAFEKKSSDKGLIDDIFRMVHTLKSETGFVGLPHLSELCHHAESLFALFRKNPMTVGRNVIDALFAVLDGLRRAFSGCAQGRVQEVLSMDLTPLYVSLEALLNGQKGQKSDDEAGSSVPGMPSVVPREINRLNKAEVSDISLVTDFINEANDHLESIETKTMELETDPSNATLLNDIFRPLHTIKGVSGFLGMRHVNQVAHESETLLDLARTGKIFMDREGIDIVFDVIDVIRRLLQLLDQEVKGHAFSDEEYPQVEIFLEQLKALTREKQAAGVEGLSATVQLKSNKKLGELLVEKAVMTQEDLSDALATQADDSEGRKLGQILVEEKKASPRAIAQALRDQRDVTVQTDSGSIKVDTQKLDNLIDVVGELVISQTLLAQNPALTASRDPALSKQVNHLTKIVRDIQYISMALRMLPIKATFQKMSRLVRDLSNKSGKQVELSINGAETELDKNVIEQINDPLVHMVRNAADHGIETPEERAKAGKSAVGRIVLNAYHQGGNIVIEIQDDGKGLNKNKIRKKAVEKGLIPADVQMDEAELFNLIFLPGFSTADKVTDISGRGVGMDVVRKNIEKLGGNVSIGSTEGKGTTFTIRLPLTMAILDGMVIQVGSERFLLPVLSIKESLRPKRNEVSTVQNKGEVVNVRGNLIQLIRLHKLFNLVSTIEKPWEGLVIIVDLNGRHYGILVDGLLGQQQVVIKSLKAEFKQIKGVSGAAILGDGHVGLILDPKGIVEIGNSDENSDKEVA